MITLILHLYDNTDNPKRSQQNATEPIYLDRNEHVIELFCGEELALKEREEQAAIKSTHFSQVLGLVLDEVISCMSKDWWKKTQLKSWKKRNDRHGKDRNRVMRVGETPEIDMHETSLEEENSIHERIEYPNRNVYKLPDPVTRALGRDFHNYCS